MNNKKSSLTCPACGGDNITSLDDKKWRCWLLARTSYQCINCRHRFLGKADFFSEPSRVLFWALALALLLVTTWLSFNKIPNPLFNNNIENTDTVTNKSAANNKSAEPVEATEFITTKQAEPSNTESPQTEKAQDIETSAPIIKKDIPELDDKQQLPPENSVVNDDRLQQLSDSERISLIKISVKHQVDQWRSAWERGDATQYLSFYSENFKPSDGIDLSEWRKQRASRVKPEKQIHLLLSNFEFELFDQQKKARVVFDQFYRSKGIVDQSRKELRLALEQGQWRITSEQEL